MVELLQSKVSNCTGAKAEFSGKLVKNFRPVYSVILTGTAWLCEFGPFEFFGAKLNIFSR